MKFPNIRQKREKKRKKAQETYRVHFNQLYENMDRVVRKVNLKTAKATSLFREILPNVGKKPKQQSAVNGAESTMVGIDSDEDSSDDANDGNWVTYYNQGMAES